MSVVEGMKDKKRFPEKTIRLYKRYWIKFGLRILVLAGVAVVTGLYPDEMKVLKGMGFFQHFSVLHILWALWLWYMLEKLLPLRKWKPRGCMKHLASEYTPTQGYTEQTAVCETAYKEQKRKGQRGAGIVLAAWVLVAVIMGVLRHYQLLTDQMLLIEACLFYVGDLVCILIWCPFRSVLMRNRCCTQCRIYNWDTLMLILPLLYIPGFYAYSLLTGALIVVGSWELSHLLHPQRFYPATNQNLRCETCRGELGCIRFRHVRSENSKKL